jgi:hypothetical protein
VGDYQSTEAVPHDGCGFDPIVDSLDGPPKVHIEIGGYCRQLDAGHTEPGPTEASEEPSFVRPGEPVSETQDHEQAVASLRTHGMGLKGRCIRGHG